MRSTPEPKLISGNANMPLAKAIARRMSLHRGVNVGLVDARVERFNDGEIFVEVFENVRGEDMFIIQPTSNPANDNLMELLIMADALRRSSARRVTAVLPYFGYARQDRRTKARTPITAKLVANLIVAAGANRILTMDLHSQQIQGFFDIPVDHLFASPVFFDHVEKINMKSDNLVVVSPDVGGMKMAAAYATLMGAQLGMVWKKRTSATTVESVNVVGDVEGRNVLLVDDITETAGTLMNAAKTMREHGALSVRAAVSHSLLSPMAYDRLKLGHLDELITTNSIPVDPQGLPITVLSVASLLGEAIMRIHNNESITGLFKVKGF